MNRAEARAALEELQGEYVACLDDGRYEEWPGFFNESCRYQILPASSHARGLLSGFYLCESQGMLHDRVLALRETSIFVPQGYRHLLGRPRILAVDDEGCRAETSYLVTRTIQGEETTMFAAGKYIDTITFAGAARFVERIVLTDSDGLDMYLIAPI